ncbi:Cytochrome P460 [Monaibacterium marinum]|uniref:Cytochrome P460 n=1 Tax=Pontivivens marinum TaxID=1690039 RepID=A0A2C9CND1_9RHOB|nr:cytochrome P460 family protein [Monaibacterium marinum]SOH92824.1 Cytochrome P460 [Monaibacterium marinum]
MKKTLALTTILVGLAGAASAQDCSIDAGQDPWDLTSDEVSAVYDCVEAELAAGYAAGDNPVAAEYRDWAVTATLPGLAGPHSSRFLMTFANDVAAEPYRNYEISEEFAMPAGSILAKESFSFRDTGAVRRGPLFIMEKVAAGTADEYGNWVYSAVQPNGNPMGISQSFCHDCHVAYYDQDNLGYPLPDLRIGN